jgi:hypothetical protein
MTQQISIPKTTDAVVQAADYFRGEFVAFGVTCTVALLILLIQTKTNSVALSPRANYTD